ncbi:MAG: endonuclease [Gammaproteobacteria bacterium]|nr:endonuclease [Gammaproteobacteria bacterium]NIM74648.1 endonuclease [Gammaproteobacteria bacterium]NIO26481.1 endonuclease [Gammaproteobacteria bacterium]NIO67033.1 endonuclease [Gammaproteobacteria bacterium]NIP46768.1 endonuclease [Gammaproteobacteria bacterium]
MEIITWNVQSGLGVDGRVDLGRIAAAVRELGDPDIICFQEVARHMQVSGSEPLGDQAAEFQRLFPDHELFFGPVVDAAAEGSGRRQFGNLMMSRLPVHRCSHHVLPRPAVPGILHMPRQATELIVDAHGEPLRIVATHLEYFATQQRAAQVQRLLALHREACANARMPPRDAQIGPYAGMPLPGNAVLCGDFNFKPMDPEYAAMTRADGDAPPLVDAWRIVHGDRPHAPTCGIFDSEQWPEGPHCRDFFFVTENLASRLELLQVHLETNASDHQPVRIGIADR